jgi:small subunit ribosomal protein S16
MSVKLRLARYGKKKAPVYRIVAIDSRKKRQGEFLDDLGTYNPLTGEILHFHEDRVQDWISKGAQPTDTVKRLRKIYNESKSVSA